LSSNPRLIILKSLNSTCIFGLSLSELSALIKIEERGVKPDESKSERDFLLDRSKNNLFKTRGLRMADFFSVKIYPRKNVSKGVP